MKITGKVIKTVYENEDGFRILKAEECDTGEIFSVKGNFPPVGEGIRFTAEGDREENRYGLTLNAESLACELSMNERGMIGFLSGLDGISRKTATDIVVMFRENTYKTIEESPRSLLMVYGIGKKRLSAIIESWEERKEEREIFSFLGGYGIGNSFISRIYKRYGTESIKILKENPYVLSDTIKGIGFKKADEIAKHNGIAPDSPYRIRSAVRFVLNQMSDRGHVFGFREEVCKEAEELTGQDREKAEMQIEVMVKEGKLVAEDEAVYLRSMYRLEKNVAKRLNFLNRNKKKKKKKTGTFRIEYDETQLQAIQTVMDEKVSVITGGPGTGKSTVTKGIIEELERRRERYVLAAPTGRAAKRLEEVTERTAETIHRLLEYKPGINRGYFARSESNPLETDNVIIDEVSMVDLFLIDSVLRAVPRGARVILIGDRDQLPSVGPGNVLNDIIDSGEISVVRLTKIYRQGKGSGIIENAHRLNNGEMPVTKNGTWDDFFFIERENPQDIADEIESLVSERLPSYMNVKHSDIQVLTPMKGGSAGTLSLNRRLKKVINPSSGDSITIKGAEVHAGDKIMQTVNDYDKNVFNGDMGTVTCVDSEEKTLTAEFDGREVKFEGGQELKGLIHSYAVTVHKSQGSEYPVVVMPVTTSHYVMLNRKIIYTAFTRAREMLVLVGTRKALAIAAKGENSAETRNSRLAERLKERKRYEQGIHNR